MMKNYVKPEMKITELSVADVIQTSNTTLQVSDETVMSLGGNNSGIKFFSN